MSCAYKVHGRTDRQTDGRKDGQGDSYIPPKLCLRGGGMIIFNIFITILIPRYLLLLFWGGGCFNATFRNILAISWRPVLVVEEAGVPGENHRP